MCRTIQININKILVCDDGILIQLTFWTLYIVLFFYSKTFSGLDSISAPGKCLPTHPPSQLLPTYLPTSLSVCLWLYSPCGPWPLYHFLNMYTVVTTPWTGDRSS
jgi:hypothetical protein